MSTPEDTSPPGPRDRRERLWTRRRERLLALLPRIYAAQPRDSMVGALLDALAGRLAELDEATERVLRDRWVALAGGSPRWDGGLHPLDRLGLLPDLAREPWEKDDAFRRRLRQIAPVLTRGSTTVRSILTVAAAAMDAELCPRLTRLPEAHKDIQDTTLGIGVRPGTVARCPGCATPVGRCIYEEATRPGPSPIVARLLLIDNPVTARNARVSPLKAGAPFVVRSPSIAADRPVLHLQALEDMSYPALRNVRSRDVMLYAGKLMAGQILIVRPRRDAAEVEPFNGYNPSGPALEFRTDPAGSAAIQDGGTLRSVTGRILYLHGDAFDSARFADAGDDPGASRFAVLDRSVLTPRVTTGESRWVYRGYTKKDITALADPTLEDVLKDAPDTPQEGRAALTLEWWTRPPASFRVRIPQMPQRGHDELPRVRDLVQRMVASLRAAGVRAAVDFPEPPRKETHALDAELVQTRIAAAFGESGAAQEALAVGVAASHGEQHLQQETRVSMQGIFDLTRMEWSHLA